MFCVSLHKLTAVGLLFFMVPERAVEEELAAAVIDVAAAVGLNLVYLASLFARLS